MTVAAYPFLQFLLPLFLPHAARSWAWTTTAPQSPSSIAAGVATIRRRSSSLDPSSSVRDGGGGHRRHRPRRSSSTMLHDHAVAHPTAVADAYSAGGGKRQEDDARSILLLGDVLDAIAGADGGGGPPPPFPILRISTRVGHGTYGIVHSGYLVRSLDDIVPIIAKRPWTLPELEMDVPSILSKMDEEREGRMRANELLAIAQRTGLASSRERTASNDDGGGEEGVVAVANDVGESSASSSSDIRTRHERCRHYWDVERHCYRKIMEGIGSNRRVGEGNNATPSYFGVYRDDGRGPGRGDDDARGVANDDEGGDEWMVFEFVGTTSNDGSIDVPALTLLDAMELAWRGQHLRGGNGVHCLHEIRVAMNLPESHTFGDTLDAIFVSLLENLKAIHDCNIVHRDLKPGNLLCANERLCLIDFGSAADLDPSPAPPGFGAIFSGGTRRVGYDGGISAISPVYCAPEIFVKANENPLAFDVFSAGLIMSQLMFNLLDERTDAGFLQQLKGVNYDLDSWLEKELSAKLRPSGLQGGLEYLGERRGLYSLMKLMLTKDPTKRISSSTALTRFKQISGVRNGEIAWNESLANDEAYFETVIDSLESCPLALGIENMPRPLHFLASFKKGSPVGLMLAEASEVVDDGTMSSDEWALWQRATQHAFPGEVFVKGWDVSSQAGLLGIFEIGDRLRGVGELPFVDGGFQQAIELINRQPKGGSLRLHFDRIPMPKVLAKSDQTLAGAYRTKVVGQGAWKSGGRRGNQEDAFVLHEIRNEIKSETVLLAGVFDGHGGTAASETVSCVLPPLFATELLATPEATIKDALEKSWDVTCETYRNGCDENGECSARYDASEGILYAETGSKDLFAGTTATIAAISMDPNGTNQLTILNCGDSRTLVIGQPVMSSEQGNSVVVFETRDHSPDDEIEIERLERGNAAGLDYSIPQCSASGSFMVVGDYQYALCRSLEGSFVTSKGIVSEPDVTSLDLLSSLADREHCALVLACDGLFEVMSSEELGREVVRMRKEGYMAGDVAKNLCGQALKKGSYDNLSCVVIYLDRCQ